jgi:hypothetical protein
MLEEYNKLFTEYALLQKILVPNCSTQRDPLGSSSESLFHPMASNTCSVFLHPLEVISRPSVTVAVTEMVKKEPSSKEQSNPSSEDVSRNANRTELERITNSTARGVDLEISGNQSVSEHVDYGILVNAEEEEMNDERRTR